MGAACLAIFKLLAALGVRPDLAAGHSYGEYVALAAAGAISETDLYALSEARGRCLVEAERANPAASGAMLAALETAERVAEIVADIRCVWISNLNSPRQTTLSGTSDGIAAARELLRTAAIEVRSIPVSCGFHSPLMAEAQERLAKVLAATSFGPSSLPIFSNTTAAPYPTDAADIAELLAEHLVNPVRFRDEIDAMHRAGARIFVEVGPQAILTGLVRETLAERDYVAISTNSALAPLTQLQHALARLFVERIPLSLDRLYADRVERDPNLSPPAPKPNLWLVNGGRARRVGEPAIRPAPVKISTGLATAELSPRGPGLPNI
jgi:acyl transferase domain-containing protein